MLDRFDVEMSHRQNDLKATPKKARRNSHDFYSSAGSQSLIADMSTEDKDANGYQISVEDLDEQDQVTNRKDIGIKKCPVFSKAFFIYELKTSNRS